jgi:mRNA interferase RelE/StbE
MSDDAPWRVTITARAQKDFQRLSPEMQGRVRAAINGLRQGPDHGDTRKLRGEEDGWRLRVGDWRVRFIVAVPDKTITITRILPRGRAYRD